MRNTDKLTCRSNNIDPSHKSLGIMLVVGTRFYKNY